MSHYQELIFDPQVIRRFDVSGPRYTSYPTADRFVESYDAEAYQSWLARRNIGGIVRPLALYLHLPFCSTLCFYCGCNKIVTRDRSKGETYLKYLDEEMALQASLLGGDNKVRQMHWGGGQGKGENQYGEAHFLALTANNDILVADTLNWRVTRLVKK